MTRLSDDYQVFNTSSAVSNAVAFTALSSLTGAAQYYVSEISLTNTSATTTILRVLGNSTTKFNIPAPASSGTFVKFDPPLAIGQTEALRLQAVAAAELEISVRTYIARVS